MSSITYSERIKIETFCELGLSNIQMGVRLNRSPSTISYELSRCQPYQAELAQTDAEYKRSRCGRKTKLSDELKEKIRNHLRLSWSPGMIAHEWIEVNIETDFKRHSEPRLPSTAQINH